MLLQQHRPSARCADLSCPAVTTLTPGADLPLAADAVRAVLTWRAEPGAPGVDAPALLLGADGRVRSDEDMVFDNQPAHPGGAVTHLAPGAGRDALRVDRPGPHPTPVLLLSGGGVPRDREIERELRAAVDQPILRQFVGPGRRAGYGVLERLDAMGGRRVDDVGSFALDDIDEVPDAELYDRVLAESPSWATAARAAGGPA